MPARRAFLDVEGNVEQMPAFEAPDDQNQPRLLFDPDCDRKNKEDPAP